MLRIGSLLYLFLRGGYHPLHVHTRFPRAFRRREASCLLNLNPNPNPNPDPNPNPNPNPNLNLNPEPTLSLIGGNPSTSYGCY